MALLLDTHVVLWMESGDKNLPAPMVKLLAGYDGPLLVSIASLWEIVIKNSLGKLTLDFPLSYFLEQNWYSHIPISTNHLLILSELPFHHKDPFDRLIAAQALDEGYTLVSADSMFDNYGVKRLWRSS